MNQLHLLPNLVPLIKDSCNNPEIASWKQFKSKYVRKKISSNCPVIITYENGLSYLFLSTVLSIACICSFFEKICICSSFGCDNYQVNGVHECSNFSFREKTFSEIYLYCRFAPFCCMLSEWNTKLLFGTPFYLS
jgi:hypothetical protein